MSLIDDDENEGDLFGFHPLDEDVSAEERKHQLKLYRPKLQAQASKWEAFRAKNPYFSVSPEKTDAVKKLCRLGIPHSERPETWMLVSGARKRLLDRPGYFADLLERYGNRETVDSKQIDRDIPRTFPNHPQYQTADGQARLRRVLVCYARHNPDVGYCQSMPFIAGFFLLFLSDEEAFWLLAAVIEDILPKDYYSRTMSGSTTDQLVFDDIIASKRPRLYKHLKAMGVPTQAVSSEWFLTLFTTVFPAETALRVIDAFLSEGAKVLFRVAVALFAMSEPTLLKLHDPAELLPYMKHMGRRYVFPEPLMRMAFDGIGSFPMKRIRQLREKKAVAVQSEIDRRASGEWNAGVGDEDKHRVQLFTLGEDNTASPHGSLKLPASSKNYEETHVTGFRVRLGG